MTDETALSAATTAPGWYAEVRDRLRTAIGTAVNALSMAGEIYVEAIDKDPLFADWISEDAPEISRVFWQRLELVGRGVMDARLVAGAPFAHRLSAMPLSQQRQALDHAIPLLSCRDTGDHLLVRIDAIGSAQAEQLFARDHIRSLEEQRAWIEARDAEAAAKSAAKRGVSGAGACAGVDAIQIDRKARRAIIAGVRLSTADLLELVRRLAAD